MSSDSVPFDVFTMDDVDADQVGTGGGSRLPEGGYLVAVTEVVVQDKRGDTQVECEVMEAKDENLIGRKHREYLKWPKVHYQETGNRIAKEQLLAWCYAAKTTNAEEIKARQAARQGFDPAWLERMLGYHVLVKVEHESYKDKVTGEPKTSAKIEARVWAVDDPKGKGIPGWVDAGPPSAPTDPATPSAPASNPFAGLV
ncbi:MAG TPA: hypothetical protein VMY37_00875 [Thermoguttaceae bacterium]|nr:hypothetical protein [Thermoguttaceae bacterium]